MVTPKDKDLQPPESPEVSETQNAEASADKISLRRSVMPKRRARQRPEKKVSVLGFGGVTLH